MARSISDHIRHSPISPISDFASCSALILSIVLINLFFIRFYILQRFLLEKLHGSKYTRLNDEERRSFLNHYISGATKFIIIIIGLYPFGSVTLGGAGFYAPFVRGSRVTMGDILLIAAQMLTGMFLFELIYRVKISPVSVAHHVGSIIVVQAAVTMSVNGDQETSIEFMLITVWGAFDIVFEFLPHLTLILYRVYPTSHLFLANIFKFVSIATFFGTIAETILAMYIFGILWDRWSLVFKILTPILHILFSAGQFHGTMVFYKMWKKQEQKSKAASDSEK